MNRNIILVVIIGIGIVAGIIAIGEAMSYFRDQEIKSVIESDSMKKALSQSNEAMQSFEKTSKEVNKTLDAVVRSFD
jgi:myo-inositol-1-phosphate synthase